MRIGLCGPHRVGKTTLMYDITYYTRVLPVPIQVSEVFTACGYNPKDDLDVDTRIDIQEKILEQYVKFTQDMTSFVVDRTPIDMIVYTKYYIGTLADNEWMASYTKRCLSAHKDTIDKTYLIPPTIPIIDSDQSATATKEVIEKLYYLFLDTLKEHDIDYHIVKETDRFARVLEIFDT